MRSKFKWIFTLLLAFTMQFSFAQEKTVTGVVSDKTGPLPGANVVIKGTTRSAQADFDGKYSIKAKAGEVLVFSFTGYNNSNVTVGAANTYNVTLAEGSVKLEEVIVEGYRNTTKSTTVVAQSTVNAKTIENRPNASFIQTLQGQVAGLNITTGSGQPGSRSTVILRGVATLNATSDPLYVIDGIPTNADNFRSINPNDIESATVLKDASATAIYGNRGTNGVIVIKTRRGGKEEGKTRFRYATTSGFTELQTAHYRKSDTRQLLTLEKNYGQGLGASLTDAEIAAYNVNTDWSKYFFRTAASTEHSFSVETQGKMLSSYTSVNYLNQDGILKGTGLKRFAFRNNVDGKSNDGKFNYGTNVSIGFSRSNDAGSLGTAGVNRNYVLGAYKGAPYLSPEDYVDSPTTIDQYGAYGLLYTPIYLIDKQKTYTNNTDEMRIQSSIEASYNIFKNTTLRSRTSAEVVQTRFNQSEHPISFNALVFLAPNEEFGGFEDFNSRRDFAFSQLWQAEWEKTFAEKHTLSVMLNSEYNFNQLNTNNFRQNGLDPATFVPGAGTGYLSDILAHDYYIPDVSALKLKKNLISYFATVDYDFDKRFGAVVTARRDGSSRFSQERKWGNFWSVGGRWNLGNESFIKKYNLFDVLKLRASYGATGNERVEDGSIYAGLSPSIFLDNYTTAANVYNGTNGYAFQLGNVNARWETTKQLDLGLDFEMFKNRLRGTFDWYNRTTIDIFDLAPISPITGQTVIKGNTLIDVVNQGVELSLAYDIVRNQDLKITVKGTGAFNDNRVYDIRDNNGERKDGNYITANGNQVYEYYVIPYAGVNPVNGNLLFTAIDGSLTENPTDADRRITHKSEQPVYQGSFGFDIDYKGFFVTSNFTFAQKVWRFDFDMAGLYDPTAISNFNVSSDLLNAWTPTNTNTNIPDLNAANLGEDARSDRFLRDASYVRLRYLQVGYKVPKKFLEKTFLSSVSIYAQGENLKTWTKWQGFDAESPRAGDQNQYPTPKIISFGVDLRF
ncbi:SusC/RagA family TonB-linked outer membrane protein [Flavobacterium silvisoli]|uniref:SusC/RagA family TonB-linked outer membrane protein n=1 Tax=Flavobacterium silvisoli TaxID=2529433 RepID=A0A4Q9YRG8_9FLAO|nr:SusC/RagA family TonB-linked outer membrane protein [Flavobacterium silvisoli]TBX65962.1 SusC/RagA family TonB-linked outer membrane protein [Flavobacterium silvisoli]